MTAKNRTLKQTVIVITMLEMIYHTDHLQLVVLNEFVPVFQVCFYMPYRVQGNMCKTISSAPICGAILLCCWKFNPCKLRTDNWNVEKHQCGLVAAVWADRTFNSLGKQSVWLMRALVWKLGKGNNKIWLVPWKLWLELLSPWSNLGNTSLGD